MNHITCYLWNINIKIVIAPAGSLITILHWSCVQGVCAAELFHSSIVPSVLSLHWFHHAPKHEGCLLLWSAQCGHFVGGAQLRNHLPELHPPVSCIGGQKRGRSLGMSPLTTGEDKTQEAELGVEPVLRPGGVHWRWAALCGEGMSPTRNLSQWPPNPLMSLHC